MRTASCGLWLAASLLGQAVHAQPAETLRAQEAALLHRRLPLRSLQRHVAGEWRSYSPSGGRMWVINLWSTRCKPCIEELPFLRRMAAGWRGERGIHFLFIADPPEENPAADLLSFWRPQNAPLHGEELLRSPDSALRTALDSETEPITLLVDGEHVVRHAFVGSVMHRGSELAAAMTRLLQVLPTRTRGDR